MNKQENNVMEQILTFEGAELKTLVINGTLYVVARELVKELGYKNINRTVKDLNERFKIKKRISTKGGRQLTTLVNQAGVLSLVAGSNREDAVLMLEWLANEVLPSISKYGMYLTPEARELRESNPEKFEGNYQEMAKELENKEQQLATLNKTSEQRRKEIQNLLDSMQKLRGELSEYKGRTMELEDDNFKKTCEISALSKNIQKKSEELDSAMTVCEVATLPIHYAIGMSSLMDDMYVSDFSEMTRGKSLDIGRNTLYQIMRDVGMLVKEGAYNVASDYGKKNGLVYDDVLTIHREYVPFETYKKPKITQKGIALVLQEVAKRLNVKPENVFK